MLRRLAPVLAILLLILSNCPSWADDFEGEWSGHAGSKFHVTANHDPKADYSFDIYVDRQDGTRGHAKGQWVERNRSFTYTFDTSPKVYTATFDPTNHDKINITGLGVIPGVMTRVK
jgi:hypothetical protein